MERKFFGTDGIRGRVGENPITAEFVLKLGWAVGKVLAREGSSKVLIGKDTRISGYMFESALEAGLSAAGVNIHLLGPMPTPAIAYLTRTLRAQAGIVISASHNPYYDNGIKFFSEDGSKLPDEIEFAIEAELDRPIRTVDSAKLGKASRVVDASGRYIEFCKSTVPAHTSFKGIKIVMDCANGATYHVAPNVFRELGAEVQEINVNPDGLNINEHCGTTHPDFLRKIVMAEQADVGIAFDGDGDRLLMVDRCGTLVDGDDLLFIIAKNFVGQKCLRGGVVGTVMSNLGLEMGLKSLGVDFARSQVGDRYVLEELKKRDWRLGGESSGHIIWLEATTTGDGIISALQVLAMMKQTGLNLLELKNGMTKYPQVLLNVRLKNSHPNFLQQPKIQNALREVEAELSGNGRVLLRPSGTEPLVRIMVEGENKKQITLLAQQLAAVVELLA
jgi:phosphoglucosamine mutase